VPKLPKIRRASNAPPASRPETRQEEQPVLEIPRVAKVLDFGDFDAAGGDSKGKRPSRRPPRP
jgi:hypothetical protein